MGISVSHAQPLPNPERHAETQALQFVKTNIFLPSGLYSMHHFLCSKSFSGIALQCRSAKTEASEDRLLSLLSLCTEARLPATVSSLPGFACEKRPRRSGASYRRDGLCASSLGRRNSYHLWDVDGGEAMELRRAAESCCVCECLPLPEGRSEGVYVDVWYLEDMEVWLFGWSVM